MQVDLYIGHKTLVRLGFFTDRFNPVYLNCDKTLFVIVFLVVFILHIGTHCVMSIVFFISIVLMVPIVVDVSMSPLILA